MYSWPLFLDDCIKLSREPIKHGAPFTRLISLLNKIQRSDLHLAQSFKALRNKAGTGYSAEVVHDDQNCRIMLILLPANAVVGLHNHPGQHGLIYCFDGAVNIDAYDEISATSSEALLDMVYSKVIKDGECATLTPEKANVHRLIASRTSLLIDVFIPTLKVDDQNKCKRYTLKDSVMKGEPYNAVVITKESP